MDNHKFIIGNRTNDDRWSFADKERAQAFLKFVINDFVAHHSDGEKIRHNYATDLVVIEQDSNGSAVNKWVGEAFLD